MVQQKKYLLPELGQVVMRHDKTVSATDKIVYFRGLRAFFCNNRQPPVKSLI